MNLPHGPAGGEEDKAPGGPSEVASRDDGSLARPSRVWLSQLLTARNIVLTTVLTVLVTSAVTATIRFIGERASESPLIAVTVVADHNDTGAFDDDLPTELVLPPDARTNGRPGVGCAGFREWAVQRGGSDEGTTRLQVLVRGSSENTVVINSMRVVIDERRDPVYGIAVRCPTAGTMAQRDVQVDLDSPQADVTYESAHGKPFGFTVSRRDAESFLVTASTYSNDVRWHLVLEVVDGDATESIPVYADGDPPFRTTATQPFAKHWEWNYQDTWVYSRSGGIGSPGISIEIPAGEQLHVIR